MELGQNSQHREDPPIVTHVVALVWKAGAWDSIGTDPAALVECTSKCAKQSAVERGCSRDLYERQYYSSEDT